MHQNALDIVHALCPYCLLCNILDCLHLCLSLKACVLYILRVGATDQMTEPTQRSFLVLLARQVCWHLPNYIYTPTIQKTKIYLYSYRSCLNMKPVFFILQFLI